MITYMFMFSADVYYNESSGTMNREELLREVSDADGIICLLRDKINKEFLEHGIYLLFYFY